MKVVFVAGYGPITTETKESAAFYKESLGLSFKEEADGYFHTEELKGVKHFALWPLSQAAQSCFGVNEWPTHLPTPTSWLEFDVEDVAEASEELKAIRAYLLKGGSILSTFQDILEGEEQSSTQKEESNHDDHADETRTDCGTCHRR